MKVKGKKVIIGCLLIFIGLMCVPLQSVSDAAMTDYCQVPPFIIGGVNPNLLLMIDNSASMYDLAYIDTTSADPTYCFDSTYDDGTVYSGYFEEDLLYRYDTTSDYFYEVPAFPACDSNASASGIFCVDLDTSTSPSTVVAFAAKGKFLNWLTASKFDIEKEVLTGGKYDTADDVYIAESRGCVGRRFIKEYSGTCDSGLACEVTFAVKGEPDPDPTMPSPGGQTYIDIFEGNYDDTECREAVEAFEEGNLGTIKSEVKDCIPFPSGASLEAKQGVVFNQTLQACWARDKNGTPIGNDEANTVKNQCPDIYDDRGKTCSINTAVSCSVDADCPDFIALGETCKQPFDQIQPGNPDYLCSSAYAGRCYVLGGGEPPYSGASFTGSYKGQSGDNCIILTHDEFCDEQITTPPVIDPTDSVAETGETYNVPALLADTGIIAQLDVPIGTLTVKRKDATEPEGLVQRFQDTIRFGAMSFNTVGTSVAECSVAGSKIPCPATDTDAGQIIHYIGDPAGDHTSGLVKAIDDIRAETWTPFAEGFYNAVAYFVKDVDPALFDNSAAPLVNPVNTVFNPLKGNPIQFKCQANNILLLTDGASTADQNVTMKVFATNALYSDGDADPAVCTDFQGSAYLDDLSYYARNLNIFDPAAAITKSAERITTYVVYQGRGVELCGNGIDDDLDGQTDEADCFSNNECDPENLMTDAAANGGTTLERAQNAQQLEAKLESSFQTISAAAASGTAASVLASGEGSGANLIQALFYPVRSFGGVEINWTGSIQNLWYYIDPFLGNSTIREDTDPDATLNIQDDKIVIFQFNTVLNQTEALIYDDNDGDSVIDTPGVPAATKIFDDLEYLWESGRLLFERDLTADDRTIYTPCIKNVNCIAGTAGNATSPGFAAFSAAAANAAVVTELTPYLMMADDDESTAVIDYIRGEDITACSVTLRKCSADADCPFGETCSRKPFRNRTVSFDSDGSGGIDADETDNTWKLGDIINSTPRIVSWVALNEYDRVYKDSTYGDYLDSAAYVDRGMVFVGANDGMLHAFNLGKLGLSEGRYEKASLTELPGFDLGKEEWAFIPQSALPYLKYFADPNYCHLYYVDATPYVFDTSTAKPAACGIGTDYWDCDRTVDSWKTILIGSLRLGGACKPNGAGAINGVETPGIVDMNGDAILDPATESIGYSSYFALDITDQANPKLLWEFTDPNLGFSTTGPSVVRISGRTNPADPTSSPDHSKNGRWYVLFGSGPTGPIATTQFKGFSDQPLRVFVLDVESGTVLRTIDQTTAGTPILNAFAGNMTESAMDFHINKPSSHAGFYQDDAVYFGYTRAEDNPVLATTKWIKGGILRIVTKQDIRPSEWTMSKVMDNIGPVTAGVSKLQDYNKDIFRLFAGSGRYYFKSGSLIDDAGNQRRLYGIKEPCFNGVFNTACSDADIVPEGNLDEAVDEKGTNDPDGWYINLDLCTDDLQNIVVCGDPSASFEVERMVTDSVATPIGAVIYTTTKPNADICEFGGSTHLWSVCYATGGALGEADALGNVACPTLLRGKAILQVSTGSIEQIDLKSAFTTRNQRRTGSIQGVPPAGSPPGILMPPQAVKRILHRLER